MRILSIVILMALSLGVALLFQAKMVSLWWVEFLLLMAAGPFILAMFFGLWVDAEWGYPFATILFAVSLANVLWLHAKVDHFTLFAIGLLISITGIVASLTGIKTETGDSQDPYLETYEVNETRPAAKKRAKKRKRRK